MFGNPYARFGLRVAAVGVVGLCVSLQGDLPFDAGDILPGILSGIVGAGAYAGVGAAIPQVEPHVGNKLED